MAWGEQQSVLRQMGITAEGEGSSLDPYDDDKQLPELVCRACKHFLRVSQEHLETGAW